MLLNFMKILKTHLMAFLSFDRHCFGVEILLITIGDFGFLVLVSKLYIRWKFPINTDSDLPNLCFQNPAHGTRL